MNLLSNAIKFTEEGVVSINVSNDDQFLYVAVTDSGPGICEENQKKLFKLFGFI